MIESPRAQRTMSNLAVGIGMATTAQALLGEGLTMGQHLNPIASLLIQNVGDFSFFSFAQATYSLMMPNRYTQEGNETKRRITAGIWAGLLLVAEVSPANHFAKEILPFHAGILLGTPDLKDIPAGALGLATWYKLSQKFETKDRERILRARR